VQKRSIQVCNILGVEIAAVSMKTALDYIRQHLNELQGKYICISNVHTTVMSYEHESYKNIQNQAALALPDGKPLSVLCKKRGYLDVERVTGPDLMREIFLCSKKEGYTHYFYGSTPETLHILEKKLKEQYQLEFSRNTAYFGKKIKRTISTFDCRNVFSSFSSFDRRRRQGCSCKD